MPKQVPRWITVITGYPPKNRRTGKPPAPAPATGGRADDPRTGFALTPHKRGGSVAWTWVVRVAIGLLLFAGLRVAVIVPIAGALTRPAPPHAAAAGLDTAAATALAVNYTADYWSYSSTDPQARSTALARWSGTDSGSAPKIGGDGQLRADVVHAGAVVPSGPDTVVVATTARVTPATLADGVTQPATVPDTGATSGPHVAADPGPAAAPFTATKPEWLGLDVVVTRTNGLHVVGAALSGDAPVALPRPTSEVDTTTTGDTSGLPQQMFTALSGSGQLSYLTVPHVQLTGLQGAVKLADVSGWSVAPDHVGAGSRYATADVTWQLTGTQVRITEPYALTMTDSEGRWLLDAVGPRIEE